VFDVIRPGDPVEELETSLVQDLLVEGPNCLFVGGLSVWHWCSPWVEMAAASGLWLLDQIMLRRVRPRHET
jgi:hypothetical protein